MNSEVVMDVYTYPYKPVKQREITLSNDWDSLVVSIKIPVLTMGYTDRNGGSAISADTCNYC